MQHSMDNGVVIAWGPELKTGCRIENAGTDAIAPTVLALLGHPAAADMAGAPPAIRTRAVAAPIGSYSHLQQVSAPAARPADEAVRQRLRSPGCVQSLPSLTGKYQ